LLGDRRRERPAHGCRRSAADQHLFERDRTANQGAIRVDACHDTRKSRPSISVARMKVTRVPVDFRRIEAALLASGHVRDAAVIERSTGQKETSDRPSPPASDETRLIAYVVADEWLRVRELRSYLAERLPDHLVPSVFVLVERLPPPTASGRDSTALPIPNHTRPDLDTPYAAPRNPVEKMLGELWAHALGLDEVGVHDDFMELGGNSLIAMRLLAAIEERFGQDTPLTSIFDYPTIASFARQVFGKPNASAPRRPGVHNCDSGGLIG
jgi:surfactin family lipopeptide synthetase A